MTFVGQFDHIIVGEYQLFKYNPPNDAHFVKITRVPGGNVYTWKTRGSAKWSLTLVSSKEKEGTLRFDVGEDCPYYEKGYTTANLYWSEDEVQIEGYGKEMFEKVGGPAAFTSSTSTTTTTTTSTLTSTTALSTAANTSSDAITTTSTIALSVSAGCLLVIVVMAIITYFRCKQSKTKRETREQVVKEEDNPVYQQYQFVGENYERQYSTHEAVDYNDYYG